MKKTLKIIASACLLWAMMLSACAHELQSNRATLVLRDDQHLTLSFFVDYTAVLHQVLAPQQPLEEFVLMYAAMKPQALQAQLLNAQRKLQGSTAVVLRDGKAANLTQWAWPDAAAVQKLLQQRAMQLVIAPADHSHVAQTEIRAETTSASEGDFNSVTLQLPAELQDVLVVSYQPKQVWASPGKGSPTIRF
jgi:hypothetical protein